MGMGSKHPEQAVRLLTGSPVDPTTVVGYALIYMATIAVVVLLLLPILITGVLLLLVAGAIQLVVYLLKVATAGAIRGIVGLFRNSSDRHRPKSHGGNSHGGLLPH